MGGGGDPSGITGERCFVEGFFVPFFSLVFYDTPGSIDWAMRCGISALCLFTET